MMLTLSYGVASSGAVLLVLAACQPPKPTKPAAPLRLLAKYQVLDEHRSPRRIKCSGKVSSFLAAGPYDCSFTVHGREFAIERKYELDAHGYLKALWVYLPEGPVVSSIEELRRDTASLRYHGLNGFHVGLLAGNTAVVDGRDTLPIDARFPREKLLLVEYPSRGGPGGGFTSISRGRTPSGGVGVG